MKKFSFIVALLLITAAAGAQEKEVKDSVKTVCGYYIELGGGANYSASENTRFFKVGEIIRYGGDITLGMMFNHKWGAEVELGYNRNHRITQTGRKDGTISYDSSDFNSLDAFINGVYSITNGIGGYDPERKGNLSIFAGLGIAYSYTKNATEKLGGYNAVVPGLHMGVGYSYALSRRVSAVADISLYTFPDNYNGIKDEIPFDGRINAQIGLRINLGKKCSCVNGSQASQTKTNE